jgi:hypothetical protein
MTICENCENNHLGDYGSGRFCSSKCARGFSTKSKRQEINEKLRNNENLKTFFKKDKFCFSCGCLLEKNVKYCDSCRPSCVSESLSKALKGISGGYRKGSGRSNPGYYKGIYCGSSYELIWVIYCLDNNIDFKRFDGSIKGDGITYFPDFIIGNTIVEIKGYHTDYVDQKTKLAIDNGYNIVVKYKKDLEKEFEWVKNNYHYNNVIELYDDYKPKYEYVCGTCGIIFYRDSKVRNDKTYCSRKCAGMAVSLLGGNIEGKNQYTNKAL